MKKLYVILISTLLFSFAGAEEKPKPKSGLESLHFKAGQEEQNDKRAMKTEMLITKSEELAIKQVRKLIRKYKGSSVEPDLQLRLAELYMRRAKSERFFELNKDSDSAAKLAPQRVKSASSKKVIKKAIKIYDMIERRFKRFDKLDVVIFNNAFARQQLGQVKSAERKYWKVIKSHNYSALVPDCHLAIGELAFRQNRFKNALNHFDAIKKYPQSRVYPYGLYKAAWSQYNLQNTMVAMKELEAVVDYGKMVEKQGLDQRLDLRTEALSDMALFYGEVYPSSDAYSYFEKHAKRNEIADLILKLARIYDRHSKFNDKDTVLRSFVAKNPRDHMIPTIYEQLVWNYESMKARPKVITQLRSFQSLCGQSSRWTKAQPVVKGEALPRDLCLTKMRDSAIKLARKWLKTWNKNKGYPVFADSSEQAFEIYLDDNAPSKVTNEARFAYAQLLFQRNKFRPASMNYEVVGRNTKLKKIGHDSRYAAILSLEKAVGKTKKWSNKDEERFGNLVNLYKTNHAKGEFLLDVEFKYGLIMYEKNKFDESGAIFRVLGENFPSKDKGIRSQDLYLDILNVNKDYVALKNYSKGLMGYKANKKERLTKLTGIYQEAYFLEVQGIEEKGEAVKAIAEYKKFAKENKNAKLAEKAWWNAVQLHFGMFDLIGGAAAAHEFQQMYPKSPNVKDGLLRSAQAYETMGQLKKAAEVLESLAKVDRKEKWKWLSLAADFYVLENNRTKAIELYTKLRFSSKVEHTFHALNQLEKLEKKKGSISHERLLRDIIATGKQPQASLAQLYFVEKIYKMGDLPAAFTEAKLVLKMEKDSSRYAKSKARFIQAEILEKEFRDQSVKSQLDRFTTVLGIKSEKLEKAQRAYQAVIRYGDPQLAVKAMVRLSKMYTFFVQTLQTMPVPEGLPESEAPGFKNEMNKLALPLEEQGVDAMLNALNQARKLDLRDGTVEWVQSEMDRLNLTKMNDAVGEIKAPPVVVPVTKAVGS